MTSSPLPRGIAAAVGAVAIAAALTVSASPALATSVTYRDGNDIYLANADGGQRLRITSDGSDAAYYTLPSADDAGNVVSFHGKGTSRLITWSPAGGGTPIKNVMPWKISAGVNAGPTWARVRADGKMLAYGYLYNTGIYGSITPRLAAVDPKAPGSPTSPAIDQPYIFDGSWWNDRLVVSDSERIFAEAAPLDFKPWLASAGQSLSGAEVARDGSRALVLFSGDHHLELVGLTGGGPPTSTPTGSCTIATSGNDRFSGQPRIALSADGQRVAWSDQAGVQIATVASVPDGAACPLSDRITLSATGGMPSFSEYTIRTGGDTGGGGTGGGGTGGGTGGTGGGTGGGGGSTGGGSALVLQVMPKLGASGLRRGQTITLRVAGAGRLSAKLLRGARTVASGAATAKGAGSTRLKLKLTSGGRRTKGLAGKRASLRVTFTPTGGKPVTVRRPLKLKR